MEAVQEIKKQHKKWSPEEVKIMEDNFETQDFEATCALLPNRTPSAIRNRSATMCLKRKSSPRVSWTKEELKALKEQYKEKGYKIPELKRHTFFAIKTRAYREGLSKENDLSSGARDLINMSKKTG